MLYSFQPLHRALASRQKTQTNALPGSLLVVLTFLWRLGLHPASGCPTVMWWILHPGRLAGLACIAIEGVAPPSSLAIQRVVAILALFDVMFWSLTGTFPCRTFRASLLPVSSLSSALVRAWDVWQLPAGVPLLRRPWLACWLAYWRGNPAVGILDLLKYSVRYEGCVAVEETLGEYGVTCLLSRAYMCFVWSSNAEWVHQCAGLTRTGGRLEH